MIPDRLDSDTIAPKCELCTIHGQERIRNGRKLCLECYITITDDEEGAYDDR